MNKQKYREPKYDDSVIMLGRVLLYAVVVIFVIIIYAIIKAA